MPEVDVQTPEWFSGLGRAGNSSQGRQKREKVYRQDWHVTLLQKGDKSIQQLHQATRSGGGVAGRCANEKTLLFLADYALSALQQVGEIARRLSVERADENYYVSQLTTVSANTAASLRSQLFCRLWPLLCFSTTAAK
ncbi:hypothetical protein ACOMHN_048341 [Nucella lapillus]